MVCWKIIHLVRWFSYSHLHLVQGFSIATFDCGTVEQIVSRLNHIKSFFPIIQLKNNLTFQFFPQQPTSTSWRSLNPACPRSLWPAEDTPHFFSGLERENLKTGATVCFSHWNSRGFLSFSLWKPIQWMMLFPAWAAGYPNHPLRFLLQKKWQSQRFSCWEDRILISSGNYPPISIPFDFWC